MKALAGLMGFMNLWMLALSAARACPCEPITPTEGFDRAQYVFTGRVVETAVHAWVVDVQRVWKGGEKLAGRIRLLDVYLSTDCEFFFEPGRDYLFFAIVAKSSRYVYYQPQVCNWTNALHSKRVSGSDGKSLWLEDFIESNYGSGESPKGEDPWKRLPSSTADTMK
jgi:hypothetical protein